MSSLKIFFLFSLMMLSFNMQIESKFISCLRDFEFLKACQKNLVNYFEILGGKKYEYRPIPIFNLQRNKPAFKKHLLEIKNNNGFIEDQNNYKDMSYGVKPLSDNGSSLIALYNALKHLTKKYIDLPYLIKIFESSGIIMSGLFGTSMKSIEEYLTKNGFSYKSSMNKEDYEEIGKTTDACILTIYNNVSNILKAVQFIAITKENEKYYIHNYGTDSYKIAYNSMKDVLERIFSGNVWNIYLTGIHKK